jgi:tRNA uridine 5-carboxymethylaminomethyl modification enzyme
VTLRRNGIGVMSCNPAIGGLGKGHLVREVDALDGLMGRIADKSGIQFRLLNRRKGPAVQGPRAQIDREVYRLEMQRELERTPNLEIIEGEVVDFRMLGSAVAGVVLADGSEIPARSVVLTTGTFLRGVIHIGGETRPGGRVGDNPAIRLAKRLDDFALPLGRLKTGTPPRLDGKTIDWNILETQPGDDTPVMFSFLSSGVAIDQVACAITHTNEQTHGIIRDNLEKSAMYSGNIEGVGPRYCPSIEDKVVRFAKKSSHQVFLEPEGLADDTVYPNGISTSLPVDVQESYVRSIRGLEKVEIKQFGYAIEYDYVDPRVLDLELSVKDVDGLWLAGQINGTTGYEEAAAQGLVAGLNAARAAKDDTPVLFGRSDSYIGVMLDDLTTRGVTEPYRMFTSRAEFRLSLRADNADQRLTPIGIEAGCVNENRSEVFRKKQSALNNGRALMSEKGFSPKEIANTGIPVSKDGSRRSIFDLLSFPGVTFDQVSGLDTRVNSIDVSIRDQLAIDALYAKYIDRQKRDVEAMKRDEAEVIPAGFDFEGLDGLSGELRSKLVRFRPQNLRQASQIEGMTPAALTLILARLRRDKARNVS